MSIDIDIIKARAKNEYRLSKVRGEAMIMIRREIFKRET